MSEILKHALGPRRCRILRIPTKIWRALLENGGHPAYLLENSIPPDAEIYGIRFDHDNCLFTDCQPALVLEIVSRQFDHVDPGEVIPQMTPWLIRE